jgi:hypothetical protein
MFNVVITDSQQVSIVVSGAVDKRGNPAKIDGTPTFASADQAICTFEADPADPSGMTGIVKAVGALSDAAAISITADADLGAGVETIVENGLVQISAGKATGFSVAVGTPSEQP